MNNEDIKVLENFIRIYKELDEKSTDFYFNKAEIPMQTIENLIKGYKDLEEKCASEYTRGFVDGLHDSISKSKVREKIEELEKFIESKRILPVDIIEDQNRNVKWKIEALQELLEGDK